MMGGRDPDEDDTVWPSPCLFVKVGYRRQGVTAALVNAAVTLAKQMSATAIEGWPRAGSDRPKADAYLGREALFTMPDSRRSAS